MVCQGCSVLALNTTVFARVPKQWWEYLSRFNYNTIHIDGTRNQVADSLSCYDEYDTIEDEYPNSKFIKVDEILDPDGDLAPVQRFIEI